MLLGSIGERKGDYDACLGSFALPLWHPSVENVVFWSPTWTQMVLAYIIDGAGLAWMWLMRNDVLGL
jgi:hypothetical protein